MAGSSEQRQEIVAPDLRRRDAADGRDRRGPRRAVKSGQLAEVVALVERVGVA